MESMKDEIVRMSRITEDLSDLSKAEAEILELKLENVEPRCFKDKFFYFNAKSQSKGLDFIVDIPEGLPPVPMDMVRITQVISNLLDNSLRHTAVGHISLCARAVPEGVEFCVADTGSGIKSADLPYVFERFYREEKSRSRKTGGTGLGLSIAKGYVEAHGGSIWASGEEGKGSRFTFFLPA